jgi:hypothetical protein
MTRKTGTLFTPATPLEERVLAGDVAGVLDVLRPLSVAERARHRTSLNRMVKLMWESGWNDEGRLRWPVRSTYEQENAAALALLLCGTVRDVTAAEARVDSDHVLQLHPAFEIPCLPELAEAWTTGREGLALDIEALVAAGVVARPDSESYSRMLMALPREKSDNGRWSHPGIAELVAADPALPQVLLRMFEVEGDRDLSLANCDKYVHGRTTWSDVFVRLMEQGAVARAELLDRTLAALGRDWIQYRAGWFKTFHERLAPTPAELRERTAHYLQLCHSRIPPTVTLALDALDALQQDGAVAAADLLAALAPALAMGNKGQVEAALKLLDRAVASDAANAAPAARVAMTALVHEAAPLQAKVLQRLEKWVRDGADREALRRFLPGIAASHRPRLLALIGGSDAPATLCAPIVATPASPAARAMPLDADRAIAPIGDLDALVQAIAYAFENDTDTDALERAFGALVAAAPVAAADRARFGPVRKRVAKLKAPVAFELGRLLAFVLDGERLAPLPEPDSGNRYCVMHRLLAARTEALMDLATQGKRLVPLATPTHRRGFIAPRELVRRQQAFHDAHALTATREQVLALLRLAPGASDADRAAARALPDTPFARALRYALGDAVAAGPEKPLFCAAARLRHPGADDAALLARYGDLGPDGPHAARYAWDFHGEQFDSGVHFDLRVRSAPRADDVGDLLAIARHPPALPADTPRWHRLQPLAGRTAALVAWSATVLPSDMEAFFAEGARALGNNLDWWEARWHERAYLEPLLDPTVDAGPMACLTLGCGLFGKEPGQAALAVDALVRLHADGRLDVDALGGTLRRLLECPSLKPARLRRSFDAALRLDPAIAQAMARLIVAAVGGSAGVPRKDLATLLELLHELLAAGAPTLAPGEREALAALELAGTARALQRRILA